MQGGLTSSWYRDKGPGKREGVAVVVRAVRTVQLDDIAQAHGLVRPRVRVGAVVSACWGGKHLLLAGLALHDPVIHRELGDVSALYVRGETRGLRGRVVQGGGAARGKFCEGPLEGEGVRFQVVGIRTVQLDRGPVGYGDCLPAHRDGLSRLGLPDFKGDVYANRLQGPVVDRETHDPDARVIRGEDGLSLFLPVLQGGDARVGCQDHGELVVQQVPIGVGGVRAVQHQGGIEDGGTFQGQHGGGPDSTGHHHDIHHVGNAGEAIVVGDGEREGVHAVAIRCEHRLRDPCVREGSLASLRLADNTPQPVFDLSIRVAGLGTIQLHLDPGPDRQV